jgi:hypothetical protein
MNLSWLREPHISRLVSASLDKGLPHTIPRIRVPPIFELERVWASVSSGHVEIWGNFPLANSPLRGVHILLMDKRTDFGLFATAAW